ncbi:MAG TPA: DUF4390 domain-containing protein [Mariprofundaceae bacterium]|nr:DUF4390 domain-containing protein [Mariprofundaceae bacterium]
MMKGYGKHLQHVLGLLGMAWLGLCMFQEPACAAEQAGFSIQIHEPVIYCAAQWNGDRKSLALALKSGIEISFNWDIKVSRVRSYWLNKSIAEISFVRRVHPDLLARTWLLEDSASGISRRVYSLADAIDFLTGIHDFPVLDKSLLTSGEMYQLTLSIEKHEGEMDEAWWSHFWRQSTMQMQQEFSLP